MTLSTNNVAISSQDEALINDLFSDLGVSVDEIDIGVDVEIEAAEPAVEAVVAVEAAEPAVEAAEPAVEAVEAEIETADLDLDLDLDLEESAVEAAEPAVEVEQPVAEEAKAPKAKKEAKAPKEKKEPPKERVTYYNSSKSKVLLDRIGGNKDVILLEASDIDLPSEELAKKRSYLLNVLNHQPITINEKGDPVRSTGVDGVTVQKKVAEKVIQLFTFLNKGGSLNKVMRIAFQVLLKDGYIAYGGKNGNLYQALIASHYSEGTARAQSGQIQQLFPLLKVVNVVNGHHSPNDDSIILAKIKADVFPDAQ